MEDMTEEEIAEERESRRVRAAELEYIRRKNALFLSCITMSEDEYRSWVKRTIDELGI